MSSFNDFLDKQYAAKPEAASTTKAKSFNDFLDEQYKGAEPEKPKASGGVVADIGKAIVRGVAKAPDAIAGLAHKALSDSTIIGDFALGNMDSSRISPAQAAVDYGLGAAKDNTTRALADKVAKELPYTQETLDASERQQADKAERLKKIDIDTPKIKSDGLIQDFNANNAWRTAKQIGAGAIAALKEPRSLIPSVIESMPEFVALAAGSKGVGIAKGVGGLGDASVLAEKARLAGAGGSVSAKEMAKHTAKVDGLATKLDGAKLAGDTALEADISARIGKANEWTAKKELANNAEKAATRQDLAIAGLGNLTLEGQGASDSARQQFDQLPDEELRKNPEFVNLENQYGFEQAKKIASEATGNKAYAPAAALGSIASLATGGGLEGALMRGFKGTATDGIVKAGLKGGFKEGSEEFIQGGSGQFAENIALNPYTGVDSMEGVAAAAGEGAAMGFLTGGVGSAAGAAYDKYAQKPVVTPEAQAAIDAHTQVQAQADTLAQQAANTGGLSGAALSGQAATAQADADTHLATAQGLQDGTIAPIQPEPVAKAPSLFRPLTQDIHAQVSNTLTSANDAIKNTKAGSDVNFKPKDATAIRTAANNLDIDLYNANGTEKLPAQLVTEANAKLANYNVASIKPDVIANAKSVIDDIDFTTPLTPTEINSLRVVAGDLGIQADPARPDLTLPKIQSTIDLHTQLNAKPAPEDATSSTTTNPSANGGTEQTVQPSANTGGSNQEQSAPTGQTNSIEHDESGFIKSGKDKLTFQHQGSGGLDATVQADNFIRNKNLVDTHTIVNDGYGNTHIQRKPNAIQENKGGVQDYKQAKEESKTANYHPAIEKLASDIEIGGGIVTDKDGRRSTSVNPDWFKNDAFKPINPLTNKPYSKINVLDVKNAVDAHKAGKIAKGMDAVKQHVILKELSSIASDMATENDSEFTDYTSESEASTESKSAYYRVTAGQKIEEANSDYIDEVYKWAELELKKPNSEEKDDAQAVIEEINQHRKNATNTQPNTAQPESPRASENTADSGDNSAQTKETVSNDTINQPTNKAQNGEGTDTTTQTTSEKVDEEITELQNKTDIGHKFASNEKGITKTGRKTTPFPKVNTRTKPHSWLLFNAMLEAQSRDDKFNERIFKSDLDNLNKTKHKTAPQASIDSAEEYLFGDSAPFNNRPTLKYNETTTRNSKPDEETTTEQDGVVSPAESGSDASTQSSKTTDEIKQNAVSNDDIEQPEGIDTLTDELKQYLVDKGIFTAQKRNGKWTALIANPDLPKFLTDHQINSLIQQVKQDVSPDKTANKVFNELGFDSNKIKAINTLSNALAVTAEDRIRNEHLIKQSAIELQAMRDNGEISEDEFNTLTADAFESNQVITKELQVAISAINNDAKDAGLGDWVKKGKSDYIVHVQPLDSTRKRLKSEAVSEIKGLSAKELSDKIKSSRQNIGLIERTMEQLKKLFHKLFSSSKNIANENTFEPIKWLSDDGKTMFTVQKAPKTFVFFSDEQLASPDKIAQANELKASIEALKSDDLKISKTSANLSGKLDGATFDFDDSLLGNNPYLKTINRVVNHEDKRVPLKGFDDVSPDNIPEFIRVNDTEIRLLESAISNAKKGISDQKNITPKIARQGATATIKLLMAHKKSGEGEAITHHYRGLELTIYSYNGADYLKVGESTAFEININEPTKVSALTPKIDARIDSLAKKDFAGESNAISQQIAEVKQTKRELAQILADAGFEQYKTDQAKKSQESRWISQQAQQVKPEPDAEVTPEVKPKPNKPTPADKPVNQTNGKDKTDKERADEKMDELKARMGQALSELNSLLGGKMNLTEEEETKLLPIMSKIFRIAAEMGYLKFKEAAGFVIKQIREALGDEAADKLSIENIQAGYINAKGKDFAGMAEYTDKTFADLEADYAKYVDGLINKAKDELKAEKSNLVEKNQIKPKSPRTKKQIEHAENVLDQSGVTGDLFAFAESVIIPVTNSGMVAPEALHKTPANELTESEAETYLLNNKTSCFFELQITHFSGDSEYF